MPGFVPPFDPPAFSLVIPAFNEVARLPAFLAATSAYLTARYPHSYEIVVVDDGSTDNTAAVAARAGAAVRCLRLPANRGKGAAVRAGMLAARGALRLFADADGATPISEVARLVRALDAGHDIAIGARVGGSGERVWLRGTEPKTITTPPVDMAPRWHVRRQRYLTGRAFAGLVRLVVGTPFADTQCGFKLFRAAAANTLFRQVRCDGWAFDVEVLALAGRAGLRVAEVPVS
jgi:dolichyl-phosphate beta-glucosyltransferase